MRLYLVYIYEEGTLNCICNSTSMRKFQIANAVTSLLSILILANFVLSKGDGSSDGRGRGYNRYRSKWIFWYYGPYGNRLCGNLCILTFTIMGLIILSIIACLLYKCICRKRVRLVVKV